MTPERWQKVKEICHLALDRESGQRAELLVEACSDDEGLRHEVESLTPSQVDRNLAWSSPIWVTYR